MMRRRAERRWRRASATDPGSSFYARVDASGVFTFNWLDPNGSVLTNRATIDGD